MSQHLTKILQNHCIKLLTEYFPSQNRIKSSKQDDHLYPSLPIDIHCRNYFNHHKSLGSKQRRLVMDRVYQTLRYNTLLNYLSKGKQNDIEYKLQLLGSADFYNAIENTKLPTHIRCSYPKKLYQKIQQSLGDQNVAFGVCKAMNTRAPFTIRINPIKTTRQKVLRMLRNYLKFQAKQTQFSPFGITITSTKIEGAHDSSNNKHFSLHQTKQFADGHFQIQDEGSQLASFNIRCQQGNTVLDYCAGSGGKSLAIAHLLKNRGQIFLHDIREKALQNAKKRFLKADIQNAQFHCGQKSLQKMLGKIDWVVVDAPCTGTGTIRRNPDLKLRFSQDWLKENTILQQQIVNRAVKYMKSNGKLVYITCSIMREENEDQIKKFVKNYGLKVQNDQILKILPQKNGMDGFFAVTLSKV